MYDKMSFASQIKTILPKQILHEYKKMSKQQSYIIYLTQKRLKSL